MYRKLQFLKLLKNDKLCNRLYIEIKKYQDDIFFPDELKSKFVRFNINTEKALSKKSSVIYSILQKKNNKYKLDEKLILEHNIEFENKMKQIDNDFITLKMSFIDLLYKNIITTLKI